MPVLPAFALLVHGVAWSLHDHGRFDDGQPAAGAHGNPLGIHEEILGIHWKSIGDPQGIHWNPDIRELNPRDGQISLRNNV